MTAPLNRDRFLKLVALAESDQDGEALAAIRRAATMARGAGMSLRQAVEADKGADTDSALRAMMAELELARSRTRIAELERQFASGTDEERLDEAHAKGYRKGYRAGKADTEREVTMKANHRIRELEAELEAYRPPMDWPAIAEAFAFKNQRGPAAGFAKGLLLRARTNKLTPIDQAELRKFAEPRKRGRKTKAPAAGSGR